MIKQDYLLRIIEQLGAALRRAMKRKDDDLEGEIEAVGALYEQLLALDPLLVRAMSIESVVGMLRAPLEMPILGAILAQEGALVAGRDPVASEGLGRRALWVFGECITQEISVPGPCREALAALGDGVTALSSEVEVIQARLRVEA